MKYIIAIPARYKSTRFPGKPLVKIKGKEMLSWVWELASLAAERIGDCGCVIGTEDKRVLDFCDSKNYRSLLTSEACRTGTDRVLEMYNSLEEKPKYIINLQGDNPFCPIEFIVEIAMTFSHNGEADIVTPAVHLSWNDLDKLRNEKLSTPFTGTTVCFNKNTLEAYWFSKKIIPAIRNENLRRSTESLSPVYRHIGLYGYKASSLFSFARLDPGEYENSEGLEQLRFIENAMKVIVCPVDGGIQYNITGIDSPEDVLRAEEFLDRNH
jgi:3-deoxy-manno-octulosonate cytidylyltransferase (CMP-KDO synthetase)